MDAINKRGFVYGSVFSIPAVTPRNSDEGSYRIAVKINERLVDVVGRKDVGHFTSFDIHGEAQLNKSTEGTMLRVAFSQIIPSITT